MTIDTLHGLFTSQAGRTPDRVAVKDGGRGVSYRDLNAQANQIAHALIETGVGPETTVAICLERSVDLIAGILGILKAGGAYVPLDAGYPAGRLQYMVSDSRARLVLTRRALVPRVARCGVELLAVDDPDFQRHAYSRENPADRARAGHLAYVIYTSGSSGTPKGVLIEHRHVLNSLRGLQHAFPAGPDDAYLFKSNHTFDASLLEMFGPMWQGGRVVILQPGGEHDPMAVLDAARAHGVTHLFFVTSMMDALFATCPRERIEGLRTLKHLLVGGEAMPGHLAARLRALAGPVRVSNVYGPTETAIICTAFPLERGASSMHTPIGSMLSGLVAHVVDESGGEVGEGEVGELLIEGGSVARGYLNAPELTAERFVDDPSAAGRRMYRTGDLCRRLEGGALAYVDRLDRQIKIRGYRVDLGEIEAHLTAHPDVTAAAVTATGAGGDLRLSAYYVASEPSLHVPAAALRRHLRRFLPDHMLPSAWRQLPFLPLNDNGKIDRNALPAIDASASVTTPSVRQTLREIVAASWTRELGVASIRPDDDFFALGGHSLSAARVVVSLNRSLGRTMTVTDLYRAPTLSAFERMAGEAPVSGVARNGAAGRREDARLSYEQVGFWVLEKLKLPYLNVIARRRVSGRIDASALAAALDRVVATHPPLRCRLSRWSPTQTTLARCAADLVERDLSGLPAAEREAGALASMEELGRRAEWRAGEAMVEVRLLVLDPALAEVQVCMPHIVSDEASGAILFDELSRHYLDVVHRNAGGITENDGFAAFVNDEREALRGTLHASAAFWDAYLSDASPICFPESAVAADGAPPESVYVDLPASFVEALAAAGRDHRLGVAELLYAASMRAVMRLADPHPHGRRQPVLHAPRSTRDRGGYDDAIGLFARIDLLKLGIDEDDDLVALARRVRRAALETSPHQRCPTMIKSAALNRGRWARHDRWCRAAARFAALLTPGADVDLEVLRAQARLVAMRTSPEQGFSVVVNVLNSFIRDSERSLFGLDLAHAPVHPTYAPPFSQTLELYFLRDAGRPQLMLNGDLRPEFRRAIGLAVVQEVQAHHAAA